MGDRSYLPLSSLERPFMTESEKVVPLATLNLPAQAIKYVKYLEELIECPVALLSTSPERDDTILMRDPFED